MLVAAVIALAAAEGAQADPFPLPSVPSLPSVPPLPPVSLPPVPPVQAPQLPKPALPQVPRPSVPQAPRVPVLSPPREPTPASPRVRPAPAAPAAPARTGRAGGMTRQPTERRAATGSALAPSPAAGPRRGASRGGGARPGRHTSREPSSKRLRQLLKPLAACVATLGRRQELVIVRRAGLRGYRGQTRSELAKTLHTSRTRIARLERRALRSLRRAVRAGGCASPAPMAAAPESRVAATVSAPVSQAGSGPPPDRQAVKGVTKSRSRSVVERFADAGRDAVVDAPAAVTEPLRSFADDHPVTFALAMLLTMLCAALLVRELRRSH